MNLEKKKFFGDYFNSLARLLTQVDSASLLRCVEMIQAVHAQRGKVIIAGNGGSASIASHIALDLSNAAGVRSVSFNDSNLITCLANDNSYEEWIECALNMYADVQDMVVLISSSGQSRNILNAAEKAKAMNLPLVTLSGFSEENPLRALGDINLWVDSSCYNYVESIHSVWLVALVDYLIAQK